MDARALQLEQDPFLKEILRVVWKRMWVVVLVAVIFTGAALGFGFLQTPTYEASAKLLVGQRPTDSERSSSLGSDIMGLQQATQTVAVAVSSKPVAESVVSELDLQVEPKALLRNLSATQVQGTQFVELTYGDSDPERAQKVANTVADVAAKRISESSASASGIGATVWEYAGIPQTPTGPGPIRYAILALGLGIMFGVGLTFLLEYLDDSWRSSEEVERISGVPNFAAIPKFDARFSAVSMREGN